MLGGVLAHGQALPCPSLGSECRPQGPAPASCPRLSTWGLGLEVKTSPASGSSRAEWSSVGVRFCAEAELENPHFLPALRWRVWPCPPRHRVLVFVAGLFVRELACHPQGRGTPKPSASRGQMGTSEPHTCWLTTGVGGVLSVLGIVCVASYHPLPSLPNTVATGLSRQHLPLG